MATGDHHFSWPIKGRVAVFVRGPKMVVIVHVAEVLTPCLGGAGHLGGRPCPNRPLEELSARSTEVIIYPMYGEVDKRAMG